MGVMVKGTVAKAGHEYMRSTYGTDVWMRVVERLPKDDRVLVERIDSVMHFPVALDGKLFEALVLVEFQGDRELAESELRKGGAYQADAMLDGLFSVLTRFVSPQQAFRHAGGIIASIYSSGVMPSTEMAPDEKGGAIHIAGLGESTFIAPWQCGWIERAVERFGAIHPRVSERNWEAGKDAADELIYDVLWDE